MKPRIYLASPFFNAAQVEIVQHIEHLLGKHGFPYYSPRTHSGSAGMTPKQRKDPKAWEPVFRSNLDNLRTCTVILAVVEWALPGGQKVALIESHEGYDTGIGSVDPDVRIHAELEIPDSGTVWELGYAHSLGKLIIGFHTHPGKALNLMLSHGTDGFITGFKNLDTFLQPDQGFPPLKVAGHTVKCTVVPYFGWKVLTGWEKDVE